MSPKTHPLPRLMALDLDETLLQKDSSLSPANRAALEAAISAGTEVVIATGRPLDTVPDALRQFPGIRYAITGNGAAVYDLRSGEALQRRVLPEHMAETLLRLTAHWDITYEAFVAGVAYGSGDFVRHPEPYTSDAHTVDYIRATRNPVPDIAEFLLQHRRELDSVDLVTKNSKTRDELMELLKTEQEVYITTSSPHLVEISHRDCGKHRGLQFLAEHLGIPQTETAAFGNADNDAEMLAWAGLGVAVENASPGCKAAADHITAHHEDDGIALAFRDLFGLNISLT